MKKKRFSLSLILILGIFVSAVLLSFNFSDNINSVSAYANDGTLSYTYSSETQSYTVVGCISTATTVSIPSTYNDGTNGDKSVTAIGNSAFVFARQSLTSITIPDSVTSIGEMVFAGCKSLISVTFGGDSQLTSIGYDAFGNCSSLTSITIPNNVTSIGNSAFSGCLGLTSITFGENSQLANLGNYAFSGCSSLTSIIIPNSVASIGNYAFNGCSSLISAIISSDITDIGQDIFDNCKNLTLTLGMATISSAFNECGSLISVILLDTVTSIGEDAFSLCTELTSITIGEDSPLA